MEDKQEYKSESVVHGNGSDRRSFLRSTAWAAIGAVGLANSGALRASALSGKQEMDSLDTMASLDILANAAKAGSPEALAMLVRLTASSCAALEILESDLDQESQILKLRDLERQDKEFLDSVESGQWLASHLAATPSLAA